MQPALYGGLFIGVLSALPIVNICNCCCVWMISSGALAAYLQQQNQPVSVTPIEGARVGALAGVAGAVVWLLLAMVLEVVLGPIREQVMGEILRSSGDVPPEFREFFEQMNAQDGGGHVFGFAVMLVVGSLMAALGGAIGASYFRKDVPPALGGPPPPPPLP
jgi:hypothetical protein